VDSKNPVARVKRAGCEGRQGSTAGAGLRCDPEVVAACVGLFEQGRFGFDTMRLTSAPDSWVLPLAHEIPQAPQAYKAAS